MTDVVSFDGRHSVELHYHNADFSAFDKDRLRACAEVAMMAFMQNAAAHEQLAISGAMRWPRSFRPEVLVATTVEII